MLLKKNIPFRYILSIIKYEAILIFIYAAGVYLVKAYLYKDIFSVPLTIPSILGTVIGLLLGFRTSQSYERWWEARTIWGGIVNDSRTLIRQLLTFIPTDALLPAEKLKFCRAFTYRQIAWCYSLGQTLRDQNPVAGLDKFLTTEEQALISASANKPNALLQHHAEDVQYLLANQLINQYQQVQLDTTLSKLTDNMGRCERIKGTVFPSTYNMIVHLLVFLFIMVLPFGLLDEFGVTEIPLVTAVGCAFVFIEETSTHMKDPFENRPTDTAVTAIARTIEIYLKQMLGETNVPEKLEPEAFYLM